MTRGRHWFWTLLLVAGLTASARAQVTGFPAPPVRRQVQSAINDLVKAYAAANRNPEWAATVRQAQQAATQARKDYVKALADAKAAIPATPELTGLRTKVSQLQARLDGEHVVTDWSVRLAVCSDLSEARGRLNAIENEALLGDADLAIAKAAVADAASAVKDAVARQKAAIAQDPGVLAARQRLDGLRRQLRGR